MLRMSPKLPFRPTLVKQYMQTFAESYGLVNRATPIKHVISPSESHSPAPHIVYMHNRPRDAFATNTGAEPGETKNYRVRKGPDPNKMCF